MRVFTHIKRLDDVFGDFQVRVIFARDAVCEIPPQSLARLVGWKVTLKELAPRMRCLMWGQKAAELVAVGSRMKRRRAHS